MNTISKVLLLLLSTQQSQASIIDVEWYIPAVNETTYLTTPTVSVGDKLNFFWDATSGIPHNVFIHPSGNCTNDGAISVGANPEGTEYEFGDEDAGKPITFVCGIGLGAHCNAGQIVTYLVAEADTGDGGDGDGNGDTGSGGGGGDGTGGGNGDGTGGGGGNGNGDGTGDGDGDGDGDGSGSDDSASDDSAGSSLTSGAAAAGVIVSLMNVAMW